MVTTQKRIVDTNKEEKREYVKKEKYYSEVDVLLDVLELSEVLDEVGDVDASVCVPVDCFAPKDALDFESVW